jgi:hypothetical protein
MPFYWGEVLAVLDGFRAMKSNKKTGCKFYKTKIQINQLSNICCCIKIIRYVFIFFSNIAGLSICYIYLRQ